MLNECKTMSFSMIISKKIIEHKVNKYNNFKIIKIIKNNIFNLEIHKIMMIYKMTLKNLI